MSDWFTSIQGIREILNAAGDALIRRKRLQFSNGLTAVDDGSKTVVSLDASEAAPTAAAVAPHLRGVGLTVSATNALDVRPRPRRLLLSDHFVTGSTVSGSIGQLGWNLLGVGTPAYVRSNSTTASAAIGNISTSGASNDRSSLVLGDAENRVFISPLEVEVLQCGFQINSLATRRFMFGLQSDFATDPSAAANGICIYYDSAVSPNYQLIARASSAGSPVVTAVAAPASTRQLLTIHQSPLGTWNFYVGNALVGTISSGIPTAGMNVGFRLETLAASGVDVRVGYFGLTANCSASLNDDDFLEA